MQEKTLNSIRKHLKERGIPIVGVADAAVLNEKAPQGFRPADYFPAARRMIIMAQPLPLPAYLTENDPHHLFFTRVYHSNYAVMNSAAAEISAMLDAAGHPSLPLPAYSPIRFHQGEPWGALSFKHAAVEAGLGKMGKSTLFIHPEYGSTVKLGGLLTALELPAGKPKPFDRLCAPSCAICIKACPVKALSEEGINKTRCMTYSLRHSLMPPYPVQMMMRFLGKKIRAVRSFLELFTLSFFEMYGIRCMECLTACPHFPGNRSGKQGSR